MPLTCDPKATFKVSLSSDKLRVPPQRFEFRYMSHREWKAAKAFWGDEANFRPLDLPKAEAIFAQARRNLVGWELTDAAGSAIPYRNEDLEAVCTIDEAVELCHLSRRQSELTEDDQKKSGSPSPSGTAGSAADAPVAAAAGDAPASPAA